MPVCLVIFAAGSVGSSRSATQAVRTIESSYLAASGTSGSGASTSPRGSTRYQAVSAAIVVGDVGAVLDAYAAVLEVVHETDLLERLRVLPEDERLGKVRPGGGRERVVREALGELLDVGLALPLELLQLADVARRGRGAPVVSAHRERDPAADEREDHEGRAERDPEAFAAAVGFARLVRGAHLRRLHLAGRFGGLGLVGHGCGM